MHRVPGHNYHHSFSHSTSMRYECQPVAKGITDKKSSSSVAAAAETRNHGPGIRPTAVCRGTNRPTQPLELFSLELCNRRRLHNHHHSPQTAQECQERGHIIRSHKYRLAAYRDIMNHHRLARNIHRPYTPLPKKGRSRGDGFRGTLFQALFPSTADIQTFNQTSALSARAKQTYI